MPTGKRFMSVRCERCNGVVESMTTDEAHDYIIYMRAVAWPIWCRECECGYLQFSVDRQQQTFGINGVEKPPTTNRGVSQV